jgi:predicted enzyme related to lactoylglutathione lyase
VEPVPHPVVHFEISGSDGDRLTGFYRALFGWETQEAGPGYWLVSAQDGGIGGGLMQTSAGMPAYVTVYVAVEDLWTSLNRAVELGGKVVVEPRQIPGIGSFALLQDPDGNMIGLFRES